MASWYTPPPFVPVKYIPAGQRDLIRAKPVYHIHVAAQQKMTGPYAGGFTNHWCLYLQTGTQESVCIDIQPNPRQAATTIPGGSKADLVVSLLAHTMSGDVLHFKTLAVPQGLYVAQVADYIVECGRDRYECTAQGTGCRKWIVDTLTLLSHKGWLSNEAVAAANADVGKVWPEQTPLEIGGGRYYDS